jgi:hypothetical protein
MALAHRVNRPIYHREEVVDDRVAANDGVAYDNYGTNVLTRIIWLMAGIILLLLAFRFLLSLLGANTTNGFADFIYRTSHPFVAPFFGLFNYNSIQYGTSRFEVYTLVAMLAYAAIAWVLSAGINIGRR